MAKQTKHGGKRPGAGRKPMHGKNMTVHMIYLPDDMWEYAKLVGTHQTVDGTLKQDAARGIRIALEFHQSLAHQFQAAASAAADTETET